MKGRERPYLATRAERRDFRREAVFLWMMPFDAILSTSDCMSVIAFLAAPSSLPAAAERTLFNPVRSFDRSARLCSRRLTFCRFAFNADLLRFATSSNPLYLMDTKRLVYHG